MNVYSEIDTALSQVQAESVNDAVNQNAGTIQFDNQAPVAAFVGVFEQKQILREDGGGFVPSTMAMVQVSKSVLAPNMNFRTGWKLIVTPPLGASRTCQIESWADKFSFWEITVVDISQNA